MVHLHLIVSTDGATLALRRVALSVDLMVVKAEVLKPSKDFARQLDVALEEIRQAIEELRP